MRILRNANLNLKRVMGEGINLILLISIPNTVGVIILTQPIVEEAFKGGVFTAPDIKITKHALILYSLGLVAFSIQNLILRVYYSRAVDKILQINRHI